MRFSTKVLLSIIGIIALAVLVWQGYLTVRYRLHNGHLAILGEHGQPEEGREFVSPNKDANDIDGYVLAAQNETLRLYVEPETGNVALYDRRNGSTVYSVHPDMKNDASATALNQSFLQSQLAISFYTANRTLVPSWNSFDQAVARGQVKLESIDGGIRVIYTMGDLSSPTGIVPVYITEERLREVLAPLEGTLDYDRNLMRYVESETAPGFLELNPAVRAGASTMRNMNELFESIGYTAEDFAADMAAAGVEDAVPLHFIIPLEFTLDGDSLLVNLNTAGIQEFAGGRITTIQVMRSFGAGGKDESGYIVVPNGSGSLIHFNNGKTYADEYVQHIYGEDPMLSDYVTLGNIEVPRFPLFGIEAEDRTILGRIDAGDTQAFLTAGISGKYNSFNYIYPTFLLRGSLSLAMFGSTGNESSMPVVEQFIPMLNCTIRYTLCAEKGYSGMANRAREMLISEGVLDAAPRKHEDIPFYMDLVGSVMGQKFLAGIRYMGQIPMTTYKQAEEIVGDLASRGVRHQIVNYQGWYNRGYYHDVPDKINPVRQLGKVKDLENLAGTVEAMGGKLYSDMNMLGVPFSSKRYNWQMESSRYYAGGMVGYWGLVNPITMYNTFSLGYPEVMHDAMSPRFITRYMDSYIKEFSKYNLTGTSLRDMGSTVVSDRRRTGIIYREDAKTVIMHNMANLADQGRPVMIAGGNMYALRYADDLINMPLSHNALYLVDDEIPFYQMIVHGRLSYAGSPINLSSAFDPDQIVTRLIEYGASPHFAFTYEGAGLIKYTGINWMYSTSYSNWSDLAADIYHAVNDVLKDVSGADIISHEIRPGGVRVITYSNGVQITVNRATNEYFRSK